jgi:hypothetical protein
MTMPKPPEYIETLTMRDQFAMAALMGLCSAWYCRANVEHVTIQDVCEDAYTIADSMIVAREK